MSSGSSMQYGTATSQSQGNGLWGVPVGGPTMINSQGWGDSSSRGELNMFFEGESTAETVSPVLVPQMGKEISHIELESVEEQLFKAMVFLMFQKNRHAVIKLPEAKRCKRFVTKEVKDGLSTEEEIKDFELAYFQNPQLDYIQTREQGEKAIEDRANRLLLAVEAKEPQDPRCAEELRE